MPVPHRQTFLESGVGLRCARNPFVRDWFRPVVSNVRTKIITLLIHFRRYHMTQLGKYLFLRDISVSLSVRSEVAAIRRITIFREWLVEINELRLKLLSACLISESLQFGALRVFQCRMKADTFESLP